MFPLKIANNYQQPASSIWQPLLETLREKRGVYCFEYMGGMHPENLQVAKDFWEEHYNKDGYKIFNIGLEPWFQQWFEYKDKHPFDKCIWWHSHAGPLSMKNWIYAPYWKKSVDCTLQDDPYKPVHTRVGAALIQNRKQRMFTWNRRPHPWRVAMIQGLLERNLEIEIRMPHHNEEPDRPGAFKPLKELLPNWGKYKPRIMNEGVDIEPGENGALVNSWEARCQHTFEVISETWVNRGGLVTFASEKTFRALRSGNLFLVWGQQGHTANLRTRGWKLFEKYINYEYDLIEDNKLRLKRYLDEIERIYNMSDTEYEDMWENTYKDRKHNQEYSLHWNASIDRWMNAESG